MTRDNSASGSAEYFTPIYPKFGRWNLCQGSKSKMWSASGNYIIYIIIENDFELLGHSYGINCRDNPRNIRGILF